jgi:hypothetical protein
MTIQPPRKRDVMLGRSARRERTFIFIDRDLDYDAEQRQDARSEWGWGGRSNGAAFYASQGFAEIFA